MTEVLTVPYEATLPSFGSPAARKHVRARDFVLQGNDGAWQTIADDEYELDKKNGIVRQRSTDSSDNDVDWESYVSYRWSGTIVTSGVRTTITNEALTFADAEYADIETGPDEQVQDGMPDDPVADDDNSSDETQSDNYVAGVSGYFIDRVTGNAEFNNITVRGTIYASAGTIGGWTIGASSITGGNATLHSSGYLNLGTSNDIVKLDATDATYRLWIGNATAASAPFRVTKAGAVTASNIDLAGGSVSGTFTVSGTLRSAASPNARYELTSAGLKTYDATNTQRTQILNDGSGWLGSSSVFSWTTAGVVSLNGSAVVGNSLDADKVTFSAPTISGLTLTNNSPGAGSVAWSSFKLTYQGTSYTVSSGNSSSKYIYWKKATSTTVLQTSATIPTQAVDMFIVAINLSGTAYQSNFAPFIYADYISVANLAAISADLGSITAGTVTGATIRTASSGARTEMNASNLFGLGFGGIGGYDGSAVQWYAKNSDGKIYAGGTDTVLGDDGLSFVQGSGTTSAVKWKSGSTVYGKIYNTVGAAAGLYITNDAGNNATEGQIEISSDTSGGDGKGGLHFAAGSLTYTRNAGVGLGLQMKMGGVLAVKTSSTTVSNTTTETSLGTTTSLSANAAAAGDTIKITAAGYFSDTGTPTMRWRAYLGSTLVATTNTVTAPSSVTDKGWHVEIIICVRSIGASGSALAQGWGQIAKSDFIDLVEFGGATTIDTTAAQTIDLKFTWGTASASNTLTCTNLTIEYLTGS